MDQTGVFLPNGIKVACDKLEPVIAKMIDDERTGTDLMRAYFHVYLNVRYIGQSNELIAVFRDLWEARCEFRDVFAGMVEAHKRLHRSARWINVLKDMQPDHVVVHDQSDDNAQEVVYAIVRPPRGFARPATYVVKKEPEETPEPSKATVNGTPKQDALPE